MMKSKVDIYRLGRKIIQRMTHNLNWLEDVQFDGVLDRADDFRLLELALHI